MTVVEARARVVGDEEAQRERVAVNLWPETASETGYVSFDRPRVLQVPARIIADLDELGACLPESR
jgi:hypothetical protein